MTALKRKKSIVNWNDNSIRLYNVKSIPLIRDDSIFKELILVCSRSIDTILWQLYILYIMLERNSRIHIKVFLWFNNIKIFETIKMFIIKFD